MSDGRTHTLATVASTAIILSIAASYHLDVTDIGALGVGCVFQIFVGPDLDVDGGNISSDLIRRGLGGAVAYFWRVFWFPYAKAIPHRSWASHGPIISTAIRYVYIPLMMISWVSPIIVFAYLIFDVNLLPQLRSLNQSSIDFKFVFWMFAGSTICDIVHYLFDWISTDQKHEQHRAEPFGRQ